MIPVPDLRELLDNLAEINRVMKSGTRIDRRYADDWNEAHRSASDAALDAAPAFIALLEAAEEWKLNWPSPKHTEKLMDAIDAAARVAAGGEK